MRYYVFVIPHAGGWRVSLCEGTTPAPEATLDFEEFGQAQIHALDLGARLARKTWPVKVIRADHDASPITLWSSAHDVPG